MIHKKQPRHLQNRLKTGTRHDVVEIPMDEISQFFAFRKRTTNNEEQRSSRGDNQGTFHIFISNTAPRPAIWLVIDSLNLIFFLLSSGLVVDALKLYHQETFKVNA